MSARIRTLVAIDAGVAHDDVYAALRDAETLDVVGLIDGLDHSWAALQETPTDLLVIACGDDSQRALHLIDAAVKQRAERPVVVLVTGSPNGFVGRAFEAGAEDIITLSESPERVRFAIEKALARRQRTSGGGADGPLVCVLGPKGGTGKTLTSCNLGVALAAAGKRTVVVDLDLQFGDVALSLGLPPERTIRDLATVGGTLDDERVEGYLATHASGLRVLVAPARPDHAAAVTVPFLAELYPVLRATYDYVIVDTPPGFTPEVIATIDASTHACVVGMLDSLSLKNTRLGLETLDLMGYDRERVTLLLNRADSRVGITRDDVAAIVGREPDVLVPSDRDIARAVNEGTPITLARPRSEVAKAYRGLADRYLALADAADDGGPPRRRLLRRRAA